MQETFKFLKAVWPDEGFYCIATPYPKGGYNQKVFNNQEDACEYALKQTGKDVFFCVNSLKAEQHPEGGVRVGGNILASKALFVDLDCGVDKPYQTQLEAINALKKFVVDSKLPTPICNSSGGGIHAFWPFTESIPVSEWKPLAEKFKRICKHFGLGIDETVTADLSRVLRVPGTLNLKKDVARPVKVLKWNEHTLKSANLTKNLDAIIAAHKITVPKTVVKEVSSLFEGIVTLQDQGADKDQDLIVSKCAQMKRCITEGGSVGYALRSHALSIIKFTFQKDYSALYNDPQPEVVAVQNDTMLKDSITSNPHTCESFEQSNPEGCKSCPHKGKIKSPISLGIIRPETGSLDTPEQVIEAAKTIAEANGLEFRAEDGIKAIPESASPWKHGQPRFFPKGQYRLEANGLFREARDDESFAVCICPQPFYPYDLIQDERNEQVVVCYAKVGVSRPIELKLPTRLLHSPVKISEELCGRGIVVTQKQANGLQEYMGSYLQRLAAELKPTEQFNQLGWKVSQQDSEPGVHVQAELEKFVLPYQVITKEGIVPSSPSKKLGIVTDIFGECGSIEEWKKVINVYSRPGYEAYAFGVLSAVGSPLMALTEYSGAIISMIGDSAAGKTTVLRSVNSWFGRVDSFLTQSDTENAFMSMIGTYGNLAITADEITDLSPERVSAIAYSISQGRSKHRLTADATMKDNESTWKLLLVSSSNRSLLTKLSEFKKESAAEAYRVFEFSMNVSDHKISKSEADEVFPLLLKNYGHAGKQYIEYVVKNLPEVREMLKQTRREVDTQSNASAQERYWTIAVAVNLVGGKIAKNLGLIDYNMEAIQKWAVDQIVAMRGSASENTLGTNGTLASYLSESVGNTLVMCGKGTKEKPFFQAKDNVPQRIWNRYEVDNNLMYVDRAKLKSHIVQGGGDYNKVIGELGLSGVILVRDKLITLSKGSVLAKTGQCHAIVIDTGHESMVGAVPKLVSIDTAHTA